MSRGFGLVVVLSSMAIVAMLMALDMRANGPSSQRAQKVEAQAAGAVGSINFTQAATQLEAYRSEGGSYVGATLPASFGVTVARAEASSYCLQAGIGPAAQHEVGPGGTPAAGPC